MAALPAPLQEQLSGRSLDPGSNAGGRGMIAVPALVGRQNSAYRLARAISSICIYLPFRAPVLAPLLRPIPNAVHGYWRAELADTELPFGMFGENFTTEVLVEEAVNIGDHFRFGAAELLVTQPRPPCYNLGLKFGRDDMCQTVFGQRSKGILFFGVT